MITKQEELKRLDELEKKVDEKLTAEKALRLGAEKEVDDLREANELLQKGSDALERRALEQAGEIKALQQKLEGYGDLAKVLGKISVDPDSVRQMIKEELTAMGDPTQVGEVRLDSVKRILEVKEVKKEQAYSDESIGGKALSVIAHGTKGKKWKVTEVGEAIEKKWGGVSGKSLGIELMRLVQEDGILARVDDGHSHFLYFLPESVVLREK